MKKKTINKITLFTALGLGVVILASCTANFASNVDKSHIMYAYDMGTTRYTDKKSELPESGALINELVEGKIWAYQSFDVDYNGQSAQILDPNTGSSVYTTAVNNNIKTPSNLYWFKMDQLTLEKAWQKTYNKTWEESKTTATVDQIKAALDKNGWVKFSGTTGDQEKDLWLQWTKWTDELRASTEEGLGVNNCPNADFTKLYQNTINARVNNVRSVITITGGKFGNFGYNHNKIEFEAKSWGYAFSKGPIEGLLVYPVVCMIEIFSHNFGMGGWGQLGAILCVTFIVRTILLLVSLRSTIGQQKMQMLQPELAKIQAKYPNANTNMAQKQRMSQEQMALYKKNKINPLGTLLVLVVQFPLFIGVWGAMQGSASLATDAVWNLHLSDSIWNTLTNTAGMPSNVNGWWAAFTLIILMSLAQFAAMKLPQWLQKAKEKKMPKLTANPSANKTQKQMKWFGYIMLVMIIIMGFTLPAGMGVYWLAGALFSIVQTVVIQLAMNGTFTKFGRWVKATWLKIFKKEKTNENI